MKAKTKAIVLALCAVLLVAASVLATLAFLKSTDSVENTFTVGKVKITLDEAKAGEYGDVADATVRVKGNEYKLIPGHKYAKDPTVHLEAGSEESYIFVKVENGLAAIEAAGETTIAAQITGNGWTALEGAAGVYYKQVEANVNAEDYLVFSSFILADDADVANHTDAKITVTAYAIQADGFDSAAEAWANAQ